MIVLGKPFNQLSDADIKRLLDEKVRESKTLEYKESLPGGSDQEKKEFLADTSAFTNTIGGTIVFGMREEKDEGGQNLGVPGEIVGLKDFNPDQDILRLENIIRSGLEPPLGSVGCHHVSVDSRQVLLIGIGRSLFGPHMVSFRNDSKFWLRGNSGRQQMSVEELRRAFMELGTWEEEAERFRRERIGGSWRHRVPPGLQFVCPLFIHLVPLGRKGNILAMQPLVDPAQQFFSNFTAGSCHGTFDLDGYLVYGGGERVAAYTRFFRNGAVEVYSCGFIDELNGTKALNAFFFESTTQAALRGLLPLLQTFDIDMPIAVFISILGLKEMPLLPPNNRDFGWDYKRIDGADIVLPGVILEKTETFESLLKPSFDILWQAAGWSECPGYLERLEKKG